MKEKITKKVEAMKKQTIGVEVEMYNITRQKASKVAAEFFGTGNYKDTAYTNGYYTWSAWDSQGREWKFQRDCKWEIHLKLDFSRHICYNISVNEGERLKGERKNV